MRQRFSFASYQLTGHDDVLLLDYMTASFDEVNALAGSYEANLPLAFGLRGRVNGSWSEYAADQFGLSNAFEGEQFEIGGALVSSLVRRPGFFVDATLGARWMDIDVTNLSTSASMPFFVPPKHSKSTPHFHVISAGVHPSDATALAKRAPSM